jgi:hypothetical protein
MPHHIPSTPRVSGWRSLPWIPLFLGIFPLWLITGRGWFWGVNWHQLMAGRDFGHFYLAAQLAAHGHITALFTPGQFQRLFQIAYPYLVGDRLFSYPPSAVLWLWPLGWLSLPWAWAVFNGIGFALVGWFVWMMVRPLSLAPRHLFWLALGVLLTPAMFDNLTTGQNGMLLGPLLGISLLKATQRGSRAQIAGGIGFGVLTLKPQLGLVIPALLLARRAWPAMITAVLTAAALVALSAWIWPGSWDLWINRIMPLQSMILTGPIIPTSSQSMMAGFGVFLHYFLPMALVWPAQGGVTLAAMAAVAWLWRPGALGLGPIPELDQLRRVAATLALGELATIYTLDYDLVALQVTLVCYVVLARMRNHTLPLYEHAAVIVCLLAPGWSFLLSILLHIPPVAFLASLVPASAFVAGDFTRWRQMRGKVPCAASPSI